jgi:outer membrane protein OmpA-like peptidoglycan-associated protein
MSLSANALAQNAQTIPETSLVSSSNLYRAQLTTRNAEAVNYAHRGGSTQMNFAGTSLMRAADGHVKVVDKKGYLRIKAEFGNLQNPTVFGSEYLTYIMWAITPQGRSVNLGEILLNDDHRGKLNVTTNLESFALIVTAEPYYAVREPSDVVVLENVVLPDTRGTSQPMHVKYELVGRGGYIPTGYTFDPVVLNVNLPLEFFEARNAIRIAKSEGADTYASASYEHAVQLMNTANGYATEKHIPNNQLIAVSREAVQAAEDARAISIKNMDEARRAEERQISRTAQANAAAQVETANAQKKQAQADAARSQSEMVANQTTSDAAVASAQADADQSRAEAQQAKQEQQNAETDQAAMRTRLSDQLNSVLQTRDSARGLIVSMSDTLFDSGKYSLGPEAREKLAKVAGILVAYPGLVIQVGGYTDNVGTVQMNQELSNHRADAVRDYLLQEGVAKGSVTAEGFGEASPMASNDNAAGRQENRRVELVVSGQAIGTHVNESTGSVR